MACISSTFLFFICSNYRFRSINSLETIKLRSLAQPYFKVYITTVLPLSTHHVSINSSTFVSITASASHSLCKVTSSSGSYRGKLRVFIHLSLIYRQFRVSTPGYGNWAVICRWIVLESFLFYSSPSQYSAWTLVPPRSVLRARPRILNVPKMTVPSTIFSYSLAP